MDEFKGGEDLEDFVDEGGRHGDDEVAAWFEESGATGGEGLMGVGGEVLENGEHGDGVEDFAGGHVLGEEAGEEFEAISESDFFESGIDAEAIVGEVRDLAEHHAVDAPDIENACAVGDEGAGFADAVVLEKAIEESHGWMAVARWRFRGRFVDGEGVSEGSNFFEDGEDGENCQ